MRVKVGDKFIIGDKVECGGFNGGERVVVTKLYPRLYEKKYGDWFSIKNVENKDQNCIDHADHFDLQPFTKPGVEEAFNKLREEVENA